MDWSTILRELGGGLSSVVIGGLGYAVVLLWRRNNQITDARVDDHKEHAAQMLENTRTLETAIRMVEARND